MNLHPVQAMPARFARHAPENKAYIAPAQQRSALGNAPKTEFTKAENDSAPPRNPEREVKVQLDTAVDHTLVYQVLDKQAGSLVMQAPSAEEIRNIQESMNCCDRRSGGS